MNGFDRTVRNSFVAMLTIVATATLAGPPVDDALFGRAPQDQAAPPRPTDPPIATTTSSTLAVTPLRIQLVPPLRDVIVEIGDQRIASDRDGVIAVPAADRDETFEFVGIIAERALSEVGFGTWSDGDDNEQRSLADIEGPTSQIGLVVSSRVTLSTQQQVPDGAELVFEGVAGTLRLPVDRTSWVPSTRAVPGDDGFTVEDLTYTLRQIVVDGVERDVAEQQFVSVPDALWIASTASPAEG